MVAEENGIRPTDKQGLRQWALARRTSLAMPRLSGELTARLRSLIASSRAHHLLIYSALPEEVNVLALAEDRTRSWYLPRCARDRRLAVYPFTPGGTPLRSGPFGIQEPDPRLVTESDPAMLDLVIVPALLLTPEGGRLGYGGGYYDRFLPRLRSDCQTIGALPSALVVDWLPLDPWDVTLDRVVTEKGAFS